MKIPKVLAMLTSLFIVVILGSAGYFAYRQLVLPTHRCDVCGRDIHAGHESTILLKDGTKVQACCPRCALHRDRHNPGQLVGIVVTDRATGQKIAAQRAVYVEGSDEISCIPESETPPREPGVMYETVYDRCTPSLAAFKSDDEAREFVATHGGRILSYAQVLDSVRQR